MILPALLLGVLSNPSVAQTEISVMSFNIRYGTADDGENSWPFRRQMVFDLISSESPDVLGVQEALDFQLGELENTFPEMWRVGVGRDDGARAGEFSAVFYNGERFEELASGTFWFSDTPDVPGSMHWGNRITRICSWVRLREFSTGRSFYVFNVHWDHESQESRERSAELLLSRVGARVGEDPVIVTGDFNAGEANDAFVFLTSNGLRDTYRMIHPDADGVGTFNSWRGETGGEKIDAVLVSDGWRVTAAEILRHNVHGRYPSDHFPVKATMELR